MVAMINNISQWERRTKQTTQKGFLQIDDTVKTIIVSLLLQKHASIKKKK